mmetsp:Transcript_33010/g.69478  ORF Transcript_33010/g.69478 Transcript_33010/m.69478 type:complete len:413 (-) Transcript_33010:151-1389(-)|eukprot:CAMPEP_0172322342 /NCGR_PEP_ID=MMETSP1058-20130122/45638_1 /TAXON_ID=83371 /ORGANISM="Detonula confervacea, Strain CCMP 353" /LENGTH=412 /DNA_ID=CAMNT_0013038065 /DNA_START=15 /DNA_END=1253 /DNA_ORIENTATION=-
MAPTKPTSNAKAASASLTSARSYRRQPSAQVKREGEYDADTASDTTHEHESHQPSSERSTETTDTIMSSRQNDFSERSWWMVDVDSYDEEGSSNQGATALVKRCMRAHDWDLAKTRKILSAYKQFLALKKTLGDWDATLLSPCLLVDQMWHQHILDNFNYYHDVMLLCGHFVGHNPDGALDLDGKVRRDRFTRECLRQHFGSYDTDVWDGVGMIEGRVSNNASENGNQANLDAGGNGNQANIGAGGTGNQLNIGAGGNENQVSIGAGGNQDVMLANAGNANECQSNDDANDDDGVECINSCGQMWNVRNTKGCPAKKTAAGNGGRGHFNDPNASIKVTIRVKDQTGEETCFKIKRNTAMSKVFDTYARRKGVETKSLRFLLDGEVLRGHETVASLDLEDDDQIDTMLNQCGC